MTPGIYRHFSHDESGATAIEFGLLAPTLLVMLFGLLDLSHNLYTAQMLEGSIQQTARSSTIQNAGERSGALDDAVEDAVHAIAPGASVDIKRKVYSDFSNVGRPEDFTDVNRNGVCDANEPFEDTNGNSTWDADRGKDGFGGARDAILYSVTVEYDRFFPIYAFIPGQTRKMTLTARTVLRNQPFGLQEKTKSPLIGSCT